MNWGQGAFRVWVATSIAWVVLAGSFMVIELRGPFPFGYAFQYVLQVKSEAALGDGFAKPFYEMAVAPGRGPHPDEFAELEAAYVPDWDRRVAEGRLARIKFPDNTVLYLHSDLTTDDQKYLASLFWDTRWRRALNSLLPWLMLLFAPVVGTLVVGLTLRWIIRGFRLPPQH